MTHYSRSGLRDIRCLGAAHVLAQSLMEMDAARSRAAGMPSGRAGIMPFGLMILAGVSGLAAMDGTKSW